MLLIISYQFTVLYFYAQTLMYEQKGTKMQQEIGNVQHLEKSADERVILRAGAMKGK